MSYLARKGDIQGAGKVLEGKAGAKDHLRKAQDKNSAVQPQMLMAGHVRSTAHANTSFRGSVPKGKHSASK